MTTREEAIWLSGQRAPRSAIEASSFWATWRTRAAVLMAVVTLFRLFIVANTGLTDTEAYYYVWSRFPALSYYDHPPLIAWLASLVALTSPSLIAVRLVPILSSVLASALLYRLTARLFSPRAGFIAVAVVALLPVFLFAGYMINPEAVLAPLWVLYLTLLDDLRRHREPWRPLLLGGVVGVAFLAKYTALLAVPVTLLVVAVTPEARHWFRRASFYMAGVVALVVASPVVAWNVQHDWPTVKLHLVERMPALNASTLAANALRALTGQLFLFHPLAFPGLLAVLAVTLRLATRDPRYRFLAITSGPVLLFFFAVMTRAADAEPHWTMVGYLPLAMAAGGLLDERLRHPSAAWYVGYVRACVGVSAVAAALSAAYVASPALLRRIPASSYRGAADPFSEVFGWDHVKDAVIAETSSLGEGAVVVSHHNVLCGHLAAALGDEPRVYCASPRRTEFDFLDRRMPPETAPIVYVESDRYPADPATVLPDRTCARVKTLDVERGEHALNEFRIYACRPSGEGEGGAPGPFSLK